MRYSYREDFYFARCRELSSRCMQSFNRTYVHIRVIIIFISSCILQRGAKAHRCNVKLGTLEFGRVHFKPARQVSIKIH